jgi:hypothetical protein
MLCAASCRAVARRHPGAVDEYDIEGLGLLIDPIDDPVVANAKGPKAGKFKVQLLLTRRFGRVRPNQRAAIRKLDLESIGVRGEALLDFRSAADLTSWLRKN